jgi:hypothetical protein
MNTTLAKLSVCAAAVTMAASALAVDFKSGISTKSSRPGEIPMESIASEAAALEILKRIEAKWGRVMREAYNWNDSSIKQFYEGYKRSPLSVLEQAERAKRWEDVFAPFNDYAAASAQRIGALSVKADIDEALETDPMIHKATQDVRKALGDTTTDLVFVPVAPCGVWDTRFATEAASAGIINATTTKRFYSYYNGTGVDFSPWGGNTNCSQHNVAYLGGIPAAAMMIVYSSDASANGWVTLYGDHEADPSNATITHYVSPGPTKTQNVVVKVGRNNGGGYDHKATARFANVNMSASVIGYYIRPSATALQCVETANTDQTVAGNGGTSNAVAPSCPTGYTQTATNCETTSWLMPIVYFQSGTCSARNGDTATQTLRASRTCCRVPGK